MIDQELRKTGIGASEVAAILGLDPRRGPFDIWASKRGLLPPVEPNNRMKWGKRLERVIAEAYAEEVGHTIQWWDQTVKGPNPYQVASPDAFALKGPIETHAISIDCAYPDKAGYGLDCKAVSHDQSHLWLDGDGPDSVPDWISIQCHWCCSATNLPLWKAVPLFGGNDLRWYTIERDKEIEAVLLEEVSRFWTKFVLSGVAPEIGATEGARQYLKQRFPKSIGEIREADFSEHALVAEWRKAAEDLAAAKKREEELGNQLKDLIGSDEGMKLEDGACVTWREQTRKGYMVQDCTFRVLRYHAMRKGKGKAE